MSALSKAAKSGAGRSAMAAAAATAAAVVGLDDGKTAQTASSSMEDERRVIFAPIASSSSSSSSSSFSRSGVVKRSSGDNSLAFAAQELGSVAQDVLRLGAGLAEDKNVQAAVLSRLRKCPELKQILQDHSLTPTIEVEEIRQKSKELEDELEWQSMVASDLTYHADRLADEKIKLVRQNSEQQQKIDALEKELAALRTKQEPAERVQRNKSARQPQCGDNQAARNADPAGECADPENADDHDHWSSTVLQAALGVAAIVVTLVVVKKIPKSSVVRSMFAAVSAAFTGAR